MKTWDCVVMNTELDMLEIRLRELGPVVDKFVVVESPVTYRGTPKRLHLQENLERFAQWQEQLIALVSPARGLEDARPREREAAQKRWVLKGLEDADADDLVLVGDLDEIPSREVVARLASTLAVPTRLVMHHAYYRANLISTTPWDDGTKACRARDVEDTAEMGKLVGILDAPYRRGTDHQYRDAGWHLAYMGGWEQIQTKNASNVMADSTGSSVSGAIHLGRCVNLCVHTSAKTELVRLHPKTQDSQLARLRGWRPDMFDDRPPPPTLQKYVYESYTFLRARGKVPLSVIAAIDARPRVWLTILAPPLLALRTARRFRMSRKQQSQ